MVAGHKTAQSAGCTDRHQALLRKEKKKKTQVSNCVVQDFHRDLRILHIYLSISKRLATYEEAPNSKEKTA
jgi:hypothetical protein